MSASPIGAPAPQHHAPPAQPAKTARREAQAAKHADSSPPAKHAAHKVDVKA